MVAQKRYGRLEMVAVSRPNGRITIICYVTQLQSNFIMVFD